jgi:uncharacterized membrane protein
MKTGAVLVASLVATCLLWAWTSGQFTRFQSRTNHRFAYVQRHQGDGLHSMICYFEQRTIHAKTLTPEQRAQGVRTLEVALRKALLPGCSRADLHQ